MEDLDYPARKIRRIQNSISENAEAPELNRHMPEDSPSALTIRQGAKIKRFVFTRLLADDLRPDFGPRFSTLMAGGNYGWNHAGGREARGSARRRCSRSKDSQLRTHGCSR